MKPVADKAACTLDATKDTTTHDLKTPIFTHEIPDWALKWELRDISKCREMGGGPYMLAD